MFSITRRDNSMLVVINNGLAKPRNASCINTSGVSTNPSQRSMINHAYILPPALPVESLSFGTGSLGTNPGIFTGGGGLDLPGRPAFTLGILPTFTALPLLARVEVGSPSPLDCFASNAARAAAILEPTDPEACRAGLGEDGVGTPGDGLAGGGRSREDASRPGGGVDWPVDGSGSEGEDGESARAFGEDKIGLGEEESSLGDAESEEGSFEENEPRGIGLVLGGDAVVGFRAGTAFVDGDSV